MGLLIIYSIFSLPAIAQNDVTLVDKNIMVNGMEIHFKTGGNGPYLLLIHGFTLSGDQWRFYTDELAEDYTLIVPDLPGHGGSEAFETRFTYEAAAELTLGLLRQLDIKRVHGIGHSAGAITLMNMAAQDPDILGSMILISGGHRLDTMGKKLLVEDRFEKADQAIQDYYLSIHPGGIPQITNIFEAMNDMASRYQTSGNMGDLSFPVLADMNTPAFLIWGDRDPYFPVDIAIELYQALPDARLWIIPGQYHLPVWPGLGGDRNAAERLIPEAKTFFRRHTLGNESISSQN